MTFLSRKRRPAFRKQLHNFTQSLAPLRTCQLPAVLHRVQNQGVSLDTLRSHTWWCSDTPPRSCARDGHRVDSVASQKLERPSRAGTARRSSADPLRWRGRRGTAASATAQPLLPVAAGPPPHPRDRHRPRAGGGASPAPRDTAPLGSPPAPSTLPAAAFQLPALGSRTGPRLGSGSWRGGGSRAGQGRGAARWSHGRLAFPTMAERGGRGRAGLCRASLVPGTPPPRRTLPAGSRGQWLRRGLGPWGPPRDGQSPGSASAAAPASLLQGC